MKSKHATGNLMRNRKLLQSHSPWSMRVTGLVLLLCSVILIAAGVPILFIGGIWILPGAIPGMIGVLGMSYAFLLIVEAGDE
jgi:uncharacterized membrane protein